MINQNNIMNWDKLISDKRFGLEEYHNPKRQNRSDFQRDFDRMIFSSPFRRLQNKTQVFPLPGSIFVHNRLTHSLEVSSVGRSMANEISDRLMMKYSNYDWAYKLNQIGDIVATACLCHDLGNPPFGHSGEKAISTYFSEESKKQYYTKINDNELKEAYKVKSLLLNDMFKTLLFTQLLLNEPYKMPKALSPYLSQLSRPRQQENNHIQAIQLFSFFYFIVFANNSKN